MIPTRHTSRSRGPRRHSSYGNPLSTRPRTTPIAPGLRRSAKTVTPPAPPPTPGAREGSVAKHIWVSLDTREDIRKQLHEYDIRIPGHMAASFNRSRLAIAQLSICGLATPKELRKIFVRFSHMIISTLRRDGKLNGNIR